MLDFKRTLTLIKGAIVDPEATWDSYLPDAGDWKKTAVVLTGPLVVGSGLISYFLSVVFPSRMPFFPHPSFLGMLLGIVFSGIAAVVAAFMVAALAGVFKGKNSFALGLAATSLAFVPGHVGNALIHIPWVGGLLALLLGIYGLVLLWRILPRYLEVPDVSRIAHYILSLVSSIIVLIILGALIGGGSSGYDVSSGGIINKTGGPERAPAGLFGDMERQSRLVESAEADTYDAPRSGKLSKAQVQNFVSVMQKTRDYRAAQTKELQERSKRAEGNQSESLGEAFSGMAGIMSLTTAEMEVVKTGGGNWAEHQWIKEQLRVAQVQKDLNDAVKHNYELYQEFQKALQ